MVGMQMIGRIYSDDVNLRIIQHVLVIGGVVMKIKFFSALLTRIKADIAHGFELDSITRQRRRNSTAALAQT